MLLLKIASGLRDGRPCTAVFAEGEDKLRQYLYNNGFYDSAITGSTEVRSLTKKGKQWLENYTRTLTPLGLKLLTGEDNGEG